MNVDKLVTSPPERAKCDERRFAATIFSSTRDTPGGNFLQHREAEAFKIVRGFVGMHVRKEGTDMFESLQRRWVFPFAPRPVLTFRDAFF